MNIKISLINSNSINASSLLTPEAIQHLDKLAKNVPSAAPVTEETFRRFLIHNGHVACAHDPQERLVGIATMILCYKINAYSVRIEHVSVLPEFKGKGIGRRLMEAVIARGKELGVKRFDLTCDPQNASANHLYGSLGFVVREKSWQRRLVLP